MHLASDTPGDARSRSVSDTLAAAAGFALALLEHAVSTHAAVVDLQARNTGA